MTESMNPAYAVTRFVSKETDDSQDVLRINHLLTPIELNPLHETLEILSRLKTLESNWDGYNAKTPEEKTIDNAREFVKLLPTPYQKALYSDELNLTPYGTVTLEWKAKKGNFVSVEIGRSKIGYLSETEDGENPFNEAIYFNSNEIPEEFIQVFKKVFV